MSIPFSEPPLLQGQPSPYYSQKHIEFQRACRQFITSNLTDHAMNWEREGKVPDEVFSRFAVANFLVPHLPAPLPVHWLRRLGIDTLPGGLKAEDFDCLHTVIYFDEMQRSGLAGIPGSLSAGMTFGVPPIIRYGSKELQERFLPELLTGKKRTCIAITEPDAGSDVAGLTTEAVRSQDGRHFIINGAKKWITNGIWADYATMAVRTGGPGAKGLSLIVVPLKDYPGVTTRKILVGGQNTAGTAYIELDDVRVPVENIIGKEGEGMKYIMTNFNHERLTVAIGVARQARVTLSAAFKYCMKREAFGKTLISQPVVRHRLAKSGAKLESLWAWLEQIAFQMSKMSKDEVDIQLGGITALAKAQAAKVLDDCARCSVLLFGGNGFTQSGQGEIAEKIYRDVNGARIPGGSEDVMLDLAIRQLLLRYQSKIEEMGRSGRTTGRL
ncbi:acyl-CoA dehydrogenase/oxidase [Aspergillus pseudoustus]|uniref:Acyl-CoA dehydrogenase/oxidase n=1 Tax=Aspergillus pseudoustus TaxID=1810923 RepID=A0ABR4J2A2_9EURO